MTSFVFSFGSRSGTIPTQRLAQPSQPLRPSIRTSRVIGSSLDAPHTCLVRFGNEGQTPDLWILICVVRGYSVPCPRKPHTRRIDTIVTRRMFETLGIFHEDPGIAVETVGGSMVHTVWQMPIAWGRKSIGHAAGMCDSV